MAQLGWFDIDFWASSKAGVGVGDDKSSWAYDGNRLLKWYDQLSVNWGPSVPWATGDVIGVACDITERTIRYARNGDWNPPNGLAFANINFSGGLTPGFTIQGGAAQSFSCVLHFGDPDDDPLLFPSPGEGYRPVWDAVIEGKQLLAQQSNSFSLLASSSADSLRAEEELSLTSSLSVKPLGQLSTVQLTVTSGFNYVNINDNVVTAADYYPSLICNRCDLSQGKWYYEITVLNVGEEPHERNIPLLAIGWATRGFFGDAIGLLGVGDDAYSWSIDNLTRMRHQGRLSHAVGNPLRKRDLVGCLADLDQRKLTFFVNGARLTSISLPRRWRLFPAFSVRSGGGTVNALQFNFGLIPFKFPQPSDVKSIHELLISD